MKYTVFVQNADRYGYRHTNFYSVYRVFTRRGEDEPLWVLVDGGDVDDEIADEMLNYMKLGDHGAGGSAVAMTKGDPNDADHDASAQSGRSREVARGEQAGDTEKGGGGREENAA